jgi:hypothetical protein
MEDKINLAQSALRGSRNRISFIPQHNVPGIFSERLTPDLDQGFFKRNHVRISKPALDLLACHNLTCRALRFVEPLSEVHELNLVLDWDVRRLDHKTHSSVRMAASPSVTASYKVVVVISTWFTPSISWIVTVHERTVIGADYQIRDLFAKRSIAREFLVLSASSCRP